MSAHRLHVAELDGPQRLRGLRYVSDATPGISRIRRGRGFVYVLDSGARVKRPDLLDRLRKLAIPPAWTDVWICPDPSGHIQASGRDARGRKQYIYHPAWRALRDGAKFDRMKAFGGALPRIRRRCRRDIARPGLSRDRVVATVVLLLDTTLVRVGNKRYAATNGSYGLTTLRDRHAHRNGKGIRLRFQGKAGHQHEVDIDDARVTAIIRRLEELPGQKLFQYLDGDGIAREVSSDDINQYLATNAGNDFTAKDFRTWAASAMALRLLAGAPTDDRAQLQIHLGEAIREVAKNLRNTPRICRRSYIHPAVIDAYLGGRLKATARKTRRIDGLRRDEAMLLTLLDAHPGATAAC